MHPGGGALTLLPGGHLQRSSLPTDILRQAVFQLSDTKLLKGKGAQDLVSRIYVHKGRFPS